MLIREVCLCRGTVLAHLKKSGPESQCLYVRYAYVEDAYKEVLLYDHNNAGDYHHRQSFLRSIYVLTCASFISSARTMYNKKHKVIEDTKALGQVMPHLME